MTEPRPLDVPQPSLGLPVMMVAFAAAAVFSLPAILGVEEPGVFCAQNCCGGVLTGALGIVPALAFRRHRLPLTPGLAFVIPLLGVFIGGIIGAIVQVWAQPFDPVTIRDAANGAFDHYVEKMEEQGQSAGSLDRRPVVDGVIAAFRYGVLLVAAGSAVIAGFVGLFTSLVFTPRRPRQFPPPPGA